MKKRNLLSAFVAFFLILGYQAFSQSIPTDTVCSGEETFYRVQKTSGSTYTWVISNGGKPTYGVDTQKDSIRVQWSPTTTLKEDYVKVIETNKFGVQGDSITLKVLRYPIPTATISGADTLFDGNTGTEKIVVTLVGTSPWDIVYNDGKTNITINNIEESPYTIKTRSLSNPPEVHTFTLVSVKNASGCTGTVSGSAQILVSPPVNTGPIIFN